MPAGIFRPAALLGWCTLTFATIGAASADASPHDLSHLPPSGGSVPLLPPADTLKLSLADAVGLALERNRPLRRARLGAEEAEAELREARGAQLPRFTANAGFTREVVSVNPFAGAPATDLLGDGAPTDWVVWNERTRTEEELEEEPIPFPEFRERQEEAFDRAGISPDPVDNPFAVPNQFQAGVSLEQVLWDPGAAARTRAARAGEAAAVAGTRRQMAVTVDSTHQAYLGALLAMEQAEVLARSVERTRAAVDEAARRVEEGAAPVSERISNQVELANLQADLVDARSRERLAEDRLRFTLGLAVTQPIALTDSLRVDDDYALADTPLEGLIQEALATRPDVEEARLALQAGDARVDAMEAAYRPSLGAFLNLSSQGRVPDDRTRVITDPLDPFRVQTERPGPFSNRFWDVGADLGVQLRWNVFGGGALRADAERARVGLREARLQVEEVEARVELEIETALRDLRSARDRARIQEENVRLAERNLEIMTARVRQGVATPLERREASGQLDRSHLGRLQAAHDYLAARSRLWRAMGWLPHPTTGAGGAP